MRSNLHDPVPPRRDCEALGSQQFIHLDIDTAQCGLRRPTLTLLFSLCLTTVTL